jgi:tRNA-dihydrouridine synthase
MRYSFFLSSMMGITDGVFCAERSTGCSMVQLGAYLAEPHASSRDMAKQSSSFLPANWDDCTRFLAQQCQDARSKKDAKVCLNLATPRLEWGLKAAESFKQAGGDYIELNVHGGYQRYLKQGKLRAMILPEHQAELYQWIEAFTELDIPLIVKFNGQYNQPYLFQVLDRVRKFDLYGIHINVRQASKQPDAALTERVRALYDGLLLVSGYIRSSADAYKVFVAGADMVGIAEPTIHDAGYISSCLKDMGIDRSQRVV